MSRAAQQALRRTTEKYVATCRLVLLVESTGRLIVPVRSRCLEFRVPAPTDEAIVSTMQGVLSQEGESPSGLSEALVTQILVASQGNLRRALLLLEASWRNSDRTLRLPEWQEAISDIATMIGREQTPKKLHEIRGKFYDLLAACIPAEIILRGVTLSLVQQVDAKAQQHITAAGAFYDYSMCHGTEAFCSKSYDRV